MQPLVLRVYIVVVMLVLNITPTGRCHLHTGGPVVLLLL